MNSALDHLAGGMARLSRTSCRSLASVFAYAAVTLTLRRHEAAEVCLVREAVDHEGHEG